MPSPSVFMRSGRLAAAVSLLVVLVVPSIASAQARWKPIYIRQFGNQLNANSLTIENHVFYDNGSPAAGIGVTNASNAGIAIFGTTDVNGWNRLNPLDVNNCTYDIRIYDPSTPTDGSPVFYWQNKYDAWPDYYSYITFWMKFSDTAGIVTYPLDPVYHYDLVDGLNSASGFGGGCNPVGWQEAPGAGSDQSELPSGGWQSYQAQTFVVPVGVNRIVATTAFLIRGAAPPGPKFTFVATIRQGTPTGPQVGPSVTSREVFSNQFKEVAAAWGIDDVPVVAGQTYAIRFDALDGQGFNTFRTVNNNYPNGQLYHGATAVPDKDLVAVVVGIGKNLAPPSIGRSPSSLNLLIHKGNNNPPDDTINVWNASSSGRLEYTITDNVGWLEVSPASGDSIGEVDAVTVSYNTGSLSVGNHAALITISDPDADNSPQTVSVNVTVAKPGDYDLDLDVDLSDFGKMQSCITGAGNPQLDPECEFARMDVDEDVDQDDVMIFINCISGSNVPSDADCN